MKPVLKSIFFFILLIYANSVHANQKNDIGAEQFIKSKINQAIQILKSKTMSFDKKKQLFRNFVTETADVKRISYFVLGRYRRLASQEELDEFTKLFYEYAVNVYETQLSQYNGEKMTVLASIARRPNDIIVYADIYNKDSSKKIPIKWRVIKRKNQYKVIDIEAFGVWLAQSQRDQFVSVIQNKNHSVQAAINILKEKIAEIKTE